MKMRNLKTLGSDNKPQIKQKNNYNNPALPNSSLNAGSRGW